MAAREDRDAAGRAAAAPTAAAVVVRRLAPSDMEAVVALDARITGRRRDAYFQTKLREALADTGIQISLAGESDGLFAGFLLARVYYGEFGRMEAEAVLDTLGVHPDFQGQGVGRALLEQLRMNLSALGLRRLRTEVDWSAQELLRFFQQQGFHPAARLVLEADLDPTHTGRRAEDEQDRADLARTPAAPSAPRAPRGGKRG